MRSSRIKSDTYRKRKRDLLNLTRAIYISSTCYECKCHCHCYHAARNQTGNPLFRRGRIRERMCRVGILLDLSVYSIFGATSVLQMRIAYACRTRGVKNRSQPFPISGGRKGISRERRKIRVWYYTRCGFNELLLKLDSRRALPTRQTWLARNDPAGRFVRPPWRRKHGRTSKIKLVSVRIRKRLKIFRPMHR